MKKKLLFASLGIIGLFLLVPFASAASSQVWFDDSTQIVWRFTGEALDASMQVTSLNSSYRKLNFTEVVTGSDHINISGDVYDAETTDVDTYGFEDDSIWVDGGFGIIGDIEDTELDSKFKSLFNELNTDLTDISGLPADNQTIMAMMLGIMVDPSMLAVFFVWALAHAFAATFGHEVNSTTINSISKRAINYDIVMDFSIESGGGYNNISYTGNFDLTYGKTSNVLLKSVATSTLTMAEWNGVGYDIDTMRARYTHEVAYPDTLVNDYPATIPGYSVWILMGAMVLGIIPAYIIIKRKKK